MQTELPQLKGRQGFAADIRNDVAATNRGGCGSTGERSVLGRGIANPESKSNEDVSNKNDKGAGSGNIVSTAPFSAFPYTRHFEPTRPFGHGISNPTPYQARRPPQL